MLSLFKFQKFNFQISNFENCKFSTFKFPDFHFYEIQITKLQNVESPISKNNTQTFQRKSKLQILIYEKQYV